MANRLFMNVYFSISLTKLDILCKKNCISIALKGSLIAIVVLIYFITM